MKNYSNSIEANLSLSHFFVILDIFKMEINIYNVFRWRYEQRIIEQRNPGHRGSTHSLQENSISGNILEQKFSLITSFLLKIIRLNETNG